MDSITNILPDELLILTIIFCSDLSKFVLHFVSKKFQMLTMDNKKNRDLEISFVMYFIRNEMYGNLKAYLCEFAASEGSLNILKWFRFNYSMIKNECIYWAKIDGHTKIIEWLKYDC
jgi:hypothetical protein